MTTIVEYKGMYYDKSEEIQYPERLNSTCAIDELWKLQITNGLTAWNFHHNSHTYKPEIVLSNYNYAEPKHIRRYGDPNIYRTENPFPINTDTRDFLFNGFVAVDAKLKGVR